METEIIITEFSNPTNEGVVIHLNEAARLKTGTGAFKSHFVSWDKIGKQLFHNYTEKCDNADLDKLRNIHNKRTEQEIIETMQNMCEESLPPDAFEKWDDIRKMLENNRKALTKQNES